MNSVFSLIRREAIPIAHPMNVIWILKSNIDMRRVELRILAYKTKSYTDSTSKILYHMHAFKHVYVHLRVEGIEPSSVGLEPTMLTITPYPLHNSFIVSYFARPHKITMRVTNYTIWI